jgi:putative chitinase
MNIQGIIETLCPNALPDLRESFRSAGELFPKYDVDSDLRISHFLAQTLNESGFLTVCNENLNYSAPRLMAVWPSRFPTLETASPYAHNPQALAERVYGGRMSNTDPGDGWRYRGRGIIQITGKDLYTAISDAMGIDLVGNPDLANSADYALEVALAIWRIKRCNPAADADDINLVTKRVNGGLIGLESRKAILAKVKALLADDEG